MTAARPRELFRVAQPFANHNGGEIAFNTLTPANSPDFGLLYVGAADGGSGGDPMNLAQNLRRHSEKSCGSIRSAPTARTASTASRQSNPFVDNKPDALGEIYAYGVRNPQRFSWDRKDGRMFVADIGQNVVEEISPVTIGANLGWNKWEGSYKYGGRQVGPAEPRSDKSMTCPIAEFDHTDPLFPLQRAAVTGIYVYREKEIKQLQDLLIFGDNPSGEIFYVNPDRPSRGGHDQIRRIMFNDKGANKTLLELIREKNTAQGKPPAPRADLRMGRGPRGQIFILNKRDGVIRLLVPYCALNSESR